MSRYTVRYYTTTEKEGEYVRVVHKAWWLYDWKLLKTVQTFPVTEEEQANAMCKLLNSIEEETDGLSK
jgi:hypothetical protein